MELSSKTIVAGAVLLALVMVGCEPGSPAIPATPDGAFTTVMHTLADGKPEIVWAALPASYQKQLQDDVVRAFAAKMDPEIYAKGVAVAKKLVGVLESKKDLIIPQVTAHPMFAMAKVDQAKVGQNWSKVVGLVDTILASELGDLNKLKNVDVGKFLRGTGGTLMGQIAALSALSEQDPYGKEFKAKAAGMKAELVKAEGDTATVKLTAPGERDENVEFVKVEGKWIPKDMVAGWAEFIAGAKEPLDQLKPEALAAMNPKIMGALAGVDAALDQFVAKAKTAEELLATLGGFTGSLGIGGGE